MTSARSCRLRFVGLFNDGADDFLRQPVVACFETLEERPNAGHETGALGGKQHAGEPGDCNPVRVGMGSAGRLVDQHQTAAGAFDRERQRTRLARIQVGERSQSPWGPATSIQPPAIASVSSRAPGRLPPANTSSRTAGVTVTRPNNLWSRWNAPAAASPIKGLASAATSLSAMRRLSRRPG